MISENSQFQISELSRRILPCDTPPTPRTSNRRVVIDGTSACFDPHTFRPPPPTSPAAQFHHQSQVASRAAIHRLSPARFHHRSQVASRAAIHRLGPARFHHRSQVASRAVIHRLSPVVILNRSQVASQAAIHRLSPARSHLSAP